MLRLYFLSQTIFLLETPDIFSKKSVHFYSFLQPEISLCLLCVTFSYLLLLQMWKGKKIAVSEAGNCKVIFLYLNLCWVMAAISRIPWRITVFWNTLHSCLSTAFPFCKKKNGYIIISMSTAAATGSSKPQLSCPMAYESIRKKTDAKICWSSFIMQSFYYRLLIL